MKTVLETIQGGASYLEQHGVENGRLQMEHLVGSVLGCSRMDLYVDFDRPLSEEQLAPLRDLVKRRKNGEPLQHLVGSVEFLGATYHCDSRALVPRPETEELMADMIRRLAEIEMAPAALDMGTGSGVIGLSLARALVDNFGQGASPPVVMADISKDALELAGENAKALGLMADVELVESDLFSSLSGRRFDLVVANLPYIARDEISALAAEVQKDPVRALDGGAIGTELIKAFVSDLPDYLNPGGAVALEIGAGQGAEVASFFDRGTFEPPEVRDDLSGNERFVLARRGGA